MLLPAYVPIHTPGYTPQMSQRGAYMHIYNSPHLADILWITYGTIAMLIVYNDWI